MNSVQDRTLYEVIPEHSSSEIEDEPRLVAEENCCWSLCRMVLLQTWRERVHTLSEHIPITSSSTQIDDDLIVGNEGCEFSDVVNALDPSNSVKLVQEWTKVARLLAINAETRFRLETRLNLFQITYDCLYYELLQHWRSNNSSEATIQRLIDILKSGGFSDSCEKLRNKFSLVSPGKVETNRQRRRCYIYGTALCLLSLAVAIITSYFILTQQPEYRVPGETLLYPYIRRHLKPRLSLSQDKLFSKIIPNNTVVFSNISWPLVSKFVRFGNVGLVPTAVDLASIDHAYYTGLDQVSQFRQMCGFRHNVSIHWVGYKNESKSFYWIESCANDMDLIRASLSETDQSIAEETFALNIHMDGFDSLVHHTVILFGSAGTGKTTFLTELANNISKNEETRVVLTDFLVFYKLVKTTHDNDTIIRAIANVGCVNSACRNKLFYEISNGSLPLFLFVTHFDQIPESELQLGLDLLKQIITWPRVKVFVSTRPNYLLQLEDCLATTGYHIEPFSKTEQTQYFIDRWKNDNKELNYTRLEWFAMACVAKTNAILSDGNESIVGYALMTYLIGEVYVNNATDYAYMPDVLDDVEPLITVKSLTNVIEKFISTKINFVKGASKQKYLHQFLTYKAIGFVFPSLQQDSSPSTPPEILTTGILELSTDGNDTLQFMHPILADYLAASFFLNCNNKLSNCSFVQSSVFHVDFYLYFGDPVRWYISPYSSFYIMSFYFTYDNVLFFINTQLNSQTGAFESNLIFKSNSINRLLLACLYSNYYNVFDLLVQLHFSNQSNSHEDINSDELILQATLFSSETQVGYILDNFNDTLEKRNKNVNELNITYFSGQYSPINYTCILLAAIRGNKNVFYNLYDIHNPLQQDILHALATKSFDTYRRTQENDKKELIQEIFEVVTGEAKQQMLQYGVPWACNPAYSAYSFALMQYIILQGADPSKTCGPVLSNILFEISRKFPEDEYHDSLKFLLKQGILTKEFLNQRSENYGSVLENYVDSYIPHISTLKIFQDAGANFGAPGYPYNETECSLFCFSIRQGYSLHVLEVLTEFQPDWLFSGPNKDSSLSVAVKAMHFSAVEFLLNKNSSITDMPDYLGNTVLETALLAKRSRIFYDYIQLSKSAAILDLSLVNLLLKFNASVNTVNYLHNNVTPFLLAAAYKDVHMLKLLKQHEACINVTDKEQNTALHYTLPSGYDGMGTVNIIFQVTNVQALIDFGLNINALNDQNLTALENSLSDRKLRYIQLKTLNILCLNGIILKANILNKLYANLMMCYKETENLPLFSETADCIVKLGIDLTFRDSTGLTYLHIAVENLCTVAVKYLLSRHVDVNARDNSGNTPLFYIKNDEKNVIYKLLKENGGHT